MSTQPPEDWNDLSAPAEDEVRLEWSAPRKPHRRLLLVLFVLSIAALVAGWFSQLNLLTSGPSEGNLVQGHNAALQLADKAVRDYARRNGQYPTKLDDAIVLPPELHIEYAQNESGFELHIANGDIP